MSVRASHLLVKHEGSRRPASWKSDKITRSKAEAIATLKEHRAAIAASDDIPAAFAKLASTESDCSSAKNGGDLGTFNRGEMQKPFEDATYGLKVGELSDVVDTDSGVHIILRTA
jgi:NIMA-interacting peptidyl-prolyl cis-trans isomerase 1